MTSPPPSNHFGPPGSGGFGPPPADAGGGSGPQGFGPHGFGPHGSSGSPGFGPPVPPAGFGPAGSGPPPRPPRRGGLRVALLVTGGVVAAVLVAGGAGLALRGGDDGGKDPAAGKSSATPSASASGSASPRTPTTEPSGSEDPGRGAPLGGGPGQSEEDGPEPSSSASATGPSDVVPYVVLKPGQCFDHPGLDSSVSRVEVRSCDGPHDGEIIANETLTGTFDTEEEIRTKALELCRADAAKRLDGASPDRTYYYYALYPARDTYTYQGRDQVSCSLTLSAEPDGPKLSEPLPG
ncbi:hypothetical protein [Streptomyces sp. NPDC018031]|uniref:hypothetical protein n=1 Tax=Streptomyces sp. NPDC018031 TaxID=3365033 RepID=UPI003792B836